VKGNGAMRHWNLGGGGKTNKKMIVFFRFQRQAVALRVRLRLRFAQNDKY